MVSPETCGNLTEMLNKYGDPFIRCFVFPLYSFVKKEKKIGTEEAPSWC